MRVLPFLLIALVVTLSYFNTLEVPFVFDDYDNIVNSQALQINDLSYESLKTAACESLCARRWLPNISFALNYYVDGLEVRGFHLVNIAIHIINGIILYLLFLATLKLPGLQERYAYDGREIALVAALIWVVHPLQTNAVTYIVQRMTSLAALFYFSSMLFFVHGYLDRSRDRNRSVKRVLWYSAGTVAALLAVVSKENTAMLILIIPAYALFFFPAHTFSRRALCRTGGIALIIMGLLAWMFMGNEPFTVISNGFAGREFTLGERLLSEARVIFFYLSLLLLPLPSRLNLNHDFAISQGLWLPPQTLLAVIGIAGLVILIRFFFKRERLLAFAILWFLANLVIESTVIPLELVFEHRLYLPSSFLILAVTALLYRFFKRRKKFVRVACLLLVPALMIMTFQRNTTWASNFTLWSDVVRKSPKLARPHGILGKVWAGQGDFDKAEKLFRKAYELKPESSFPDYYLGELYAEQNRFEEAAVFFRRALSKDRVDKLKVCNALGSVYRKAKDYPNAIIFSLIALELDPDNLEAMVNLGISYESSGRHQEALRIFAGAAAKGFKSVDLYNNWGVSAFSLKMVDNSILYFQEAIKIDPEHPESHYNLGIAYGNKGLFSEARKEMARAMNLREKSAK